MRKVIKDSILNIINKALEYIPKKDITQLKRLSNYTIHNSSIFQDENSLSIAIIIYSISKIIDREKDIIPKDDETIIKSFIINFKKMKTALENENMDIYKAKITNIFKQIKNLDKKTTEYVQEVILKSKIKKGTAMFQHGISLAQVAQALQISQWDLMDYIGQTQTSDREGKTKINITKRLSFARQLFGL